MTSESQLMGTIGESVEGCPRYPYSAASPLNINFTAPSSEDLTRNVNDTIEDIKLLYTYMTRIVNYYIEQNSEIIIQINNLLLGEEVVSIQPSTYKTTIARYEKNVKILEKILKNLQSDSTNFISEVNEYQKLLNEYISTMNSIEINLAEIDNPTSLRKSADKSSSYMVLNKEIKNSLLLKNELREQKEDVVEFINSIKHQFQNYTTNQIIFDPFDSKVFYNINIEEKEIRRQFSTLKEDKITIINKLLQGNKPEIVEKLKQINLENLVFPSTETLEADIQQLEESMQASTQLYSQQVSDIFKSDIGKRITRLSVPPIPKPTLIPIGVVIPINLEQHDILYQPCCNILSENKMFVTNVIEISFINERLVAEFFVNENYNDSFREMQNRRLSYRSDVNILNLPEKIEIANIIRNVPKNIQDLFNNYNILNRKKLLKLPLAINAAIHFTDKHDVFMLFLNNDNRAYIINTIFYSVLCLYAVRNYIQSENDGERMIFVMKILNYFLEINNYPINLQSTISNIFSNSDKICNSIIKINEKIERLSSPKIIQKRTKLNEINLVPLFENDPLLYQLFTNLNDFTHCSDNDFLLLILRTMYLCASVLRNARYKIYAMIELTDEQKNNSFSQLTERLRQYIYNEYYKINNDLDIDVSFILLFKRQLMTGMPYFYLSNVIYDFIQLGVYYFFESMINVNNVLDFESIYNYYAKLFDNDQKILFLKIYNTSFRAHNKLAVRLINDRMDVYFNILRRPYIDERDAIPFNDWFGFKLIDKTAEEIEENTLNRDIINVANESKVTFQSDLKQVYRI